MHTGGVGVVQGMNRRQRSSQAVWRPARGLASVEHECVLGKMELRLTGRQGPDHKPQGLDRAADFSLQTQGRQDPSTRVGENLLSERRAYKSQAD